MAAIESLKKLEYNSLEQLMEDLNRNFAVIENSPLYKGIGGDPGDPGDPGLMGVRGGQFIFVLLENFITQFPGETNVASKITLDFLNTKLLAFEDKQKLLASLKVSELVDKDIIVLTNSMMLSYDRINNKFIDTRQAFNQQTNLASNIENKIEYFVQLYVENNQTIANLTNIFEGFSTYAKNYTDNNSSFITTSITPSSVYVPYINGYTSSVGVKLTDHRYFGFADDQFPKENNGTLVVGAMKRYIDLMMSTVSTGGTETLSSEYAPGVNNIPSLVFLQDTQNAGLMFGYKGKENLKRFGAIFKNDLDEVVIKSDSGVNESDFAALYIHRNYMKFKKLVQFLDNLNVSKDFVLVGNIDNRFIKTGRFSSTENPDTMEIGVAEGLLINKFGNIKLSSFVSNVLVTGADGTVSKEYSLETTSISPAQEVNIVPITTIPNSDKKILTSNYLGFAIRKINSLTAYAIEHYWRKNQFNTGDIPAMKLNNDLEVADLLKIQRATRTMTSGAADSTLIEKAVNVTFEKFPNQVLVTGASGVLLKTVSLETSATQPSEETGLNNITNSANLTTKIPTSNYLGFIIRKINNVSSWITTNVWRKDQFATGDIPEVKTASKLSVATIFSVDALTKIINIGITTGSTNLKSTNLKLDEFVNNVLVTDNAGNVSKAYSIETTEFLDEDLVDINEISAGPYESTKITTSALINQLAQKINAIQYWFNNYWSKGETAGGNIPLIWSQNLKTTYQLLVGSSGNPTLNVDTANKTVDVGMSDVAAIVNVRSNNVKFNEFKTKVLITDANGNVLKTHSIETNGLTAYNINIDGQITSVITASTNVLTSNYFDFIIRMTNNIKAKFANYYTKTEIDTKLNAAMPIGSIIMWGKTNAEIPTNWKICDGSYGTPNLINKFIKASSTNGAAAIPVKINNVEPAATQFAANYRYLDTSRLPDHGHTATVNIDHLHTTPFFDVGQQIYWDQHVVEKTGGVNNGVFGSGASDSDNRFPFDNQFYAPGGLSYKDSGGFPELIATPPTWATAPLCGFWRMTDSKFHRLKTYKLSESYADIEKRKYIGDTVNYRNRVDATSTTSAIYGQNAPVINVEIDQAGFNPTKNISFNIDEQLQYEPIDITPYHYCLVYIMKVS